MIALTEFFIHDAHEPSMTAASDISSLKFSSALWLCPLTPRKAGTCRPETVIEPPRTGFGKTMKTWEKRPCGEPESALAAKRARHLCFNGAQRES